MRKNLRGQFQALAASFSQNDVQTRDWEKTGSNEIPPGMNRVSSELVAWEWMAHHRYVLGGGLCELCALCALGRAMDLHRMNKVTATIKNHLQI
jgi:hypothetical protein